MIRVPQLRVVDEDGTQLGVMPTLEAFRLAQERGYDLVEVAPMALPPVARLLDYGQYKYEQTRREKEARRHQRSVEFKEIRLRPKIGIGDFETKVRRAIQFLEDGDRVKVSCQFRGRELSHAFIGRDLLVKFGDLIKEHGTVERMPLLEGKSMSIVIASSHKPKLQPTSGRGDEEGTQGSGEGDTAPAARPPQPAPAASGAAPASQPATSTTVETSPAQPALDRPMTTEDQTQPVRRPTPRPAARQQRTAAPATPIPSARNDPGDQ